MKRNLKEVEEFLLLAKEIGADEINFCHMVMYEGLEVQKESLFYFKEEANYAIDKIKEICNKLQLKLGYCPEKFSLEKEDSEPLRPQRKFCKSPWNVIAITANGDILPCTYGWRHEIMGNIKREKFSDIWNNAKFLKLRYQMLTGNLPQCCLACPPVGSGDIDDIQSFAERNLSKRF